MKEIIILTGASCSGKTLLASFLARNFGYFHIEASDFMRYELHKCNDFSDLFSIHEFAAIKLAENSLLVAEQVWKYIKDSGPEKYVITGFRSMDEVKYLRSKNNNVSVFYIVASKSIRFTRCLSRERPDYLEKLNDFEKRDQLQNTMGLGLIKHTGTITKIKNEGSKFEYLRRFALSYVPEGVKKSEKPMNQKFILNGELSLESAIYLVLLQSYYAGWEFESCSSIAIKLKQMGWTSELKKELIDGISNLLEASPSPFHETSNKHGQKCFRLSITGISHAKKI